MDYGCASIMHVLICTFCQQKMAVLGSVVGAERDIVSCELRPLMLWLTSPHGAQPPVKFQPVPSASACTVFAFKRFSHGLFLAVATTENVILYKHDSKIHSFSIQAVSAYLYLSLLLIIIVTTTDNATAFYFSLMTSFSLVTS